MPKLSATKLNHWLTALAVVLLSEMILTFAVRTNKLNFKPEIDIAVFTTVPLFLLTLLQLARHLAVQRATFVTGYLSRLYTNQGLSEAFQELVATYTNSLFEAVNKAVKQANPPEGERPVFGPFSDLQKGRSEGHRLYHPDYFQGSPEERRLDALLGYYDIIGYYYKAGLIGMVDIAGTIGYQLALLSSREVIEVYLRGSNREWWMKTKFYTGTGAQLPFTYLRLLLKDFKKYNERNKRKIDDLMERAEGIGA